MSLIRKHVAVLQAWACLALVCPGNEIISDNNVPYAKTAVTYVCMQ